MSIYRIKIIESFMNISLKIDIMQKMKKNPLKYTSAAIQLIFDDVKRVAFAVKILSMLATAFYLTFMIIRGTGNLYANIVLLSLLVMYSIFDLVTSINIKEHKHIRKHVKRFYKIAKIIVKAGVLATNLYGIYVATTITSATTLISTVLSLVLWVISILLEIIIYIVERRIALVKESFAKDMEITLQPITKTRNFFKRLKGEEEITPAKESKMFMKFKKKADEDELRKNGEVIENDDEEYIEDKPEKKKKKFRLPLIGKK